MRRPEGYVTSVQKRLDFGLAAAAVASLFAGGLFAACGNGDGDAMPTGSVGGSTPKGGGAGRSNAAGGSGASDDGAGRDGGRAGYDGAGGAETGGSGGMCAGSSRPLALAPLDLFVLLDRSGSMSTATGKGLSTWKATTAALGAAFADPSTAGVNVGLQFFPLGEQRDEQCEAALYEDPKQSFVPLPDTTNLASAMASEGPDNGTLNGCPTGAALDGALTYAKGWAASRPDHGVAVVLVTDGPPAIPTGACQGAPPIDRSIDPNEVAGLVEKYATADPPIDSFMIGVTTAKDGTQHVAAFLTFANAVASAGSTGGKAWVVDLDDDDAAALVAKAVAEIRASTSPCDAPLPATDDAGKPVRYDEVNVLSTDGTSHQTGVILAVADAAHCDGTKGGWYYDVDPSKGTPSKIVMCKATCDELHGASTGRLEIEFHCPTLRLRAP